MKLKVNQEFSKTNAPTPYIVGSQNPARLLTSQTSQLHTRNDPPSFIPRRVSPQKNQNLKTKLGKIHENAQATFKTSRKLVQLVHSA